MFQGPRRGWGRGGAGWGPPPLTAASPTSPFDWHCPGPPHFAPAIESRSQPSCWDQSAVPRGWRGLGTAGRAGLRVCWGVAARGIPVSSPHSVLPPPQKQLPPQALHKAGWVLVNMRCFLHASVHPLRPLQFENVPDWPACREPEPSSQKASVRSLVYITSLCLVDWLLTHISSKRNASLQAMFTSGGVLGDVLAWGWRTRSW
ncbi:uncharacterized protein LOC130458040 [Monodelphis domestica]|uniref:uncharacterized protein LOC130458040 n=1 Tax=Monodelphis domestica TaxID=13616 RepID=UPI0024E1E8F9|nr:uncharacterized protein LOC130458040 [Monodelphis domestica]